jgi:sec-independent protein translocase protein TatB
MFEIAWSELLIVLIVAILVVGPKELPGMLRAFGRIIGKLRRQADDFRRQFDDSIRDVGGEDLQRELDELRRNNPLNQIRNTIEDAAREATRPALPTPEAYVDKPEEPPVVHETFTEPQPTPPQPVAPPAQTAETAPAPSPSPAPDAPKEQPSVSPGHEPVINGQHRPLS